LNLVEVWARSSLPLALASLLLACGPSGSASRDASAASGSSSAGEQCLADARAERHPPASAPDRISVRHILVRHRELTRPDGATRTPEEACLRALAALERLEGGAEWSAVALEFSDSKTDDLGEVSRDQLSPAFGDAAFELESGELSYVVESDRGFHVILRK
jgi:peptidyl-prolyl cis-trans isomerase NIMA-interacting 1